MYIGPSTTVAFQNGTSHTYENYATTVEDFTGVDSGAAFYQSFCNASTKAEAAVSASATASNFKRNAAATTASAAAPFSTAPAPTPTGGNPRLLYPEAKIQSPDGTVAGYFLNGTGYEETAVLSISEESETDPLGAQAAVSEFLAACTNASKKKLILDFSNNPGGQFILAYDWFKQVRLREKLRCKVDTAFRCFTWLTRVHKRSGQSSRRVPRLLINCFSAFPNHRALRSSEHARHAGI